MRTKLIQMYFCLGIGQDQLTLSYHDIGFNEVLVSKKDNTTIFEYPNNKGFKQAKSYFNKF
jgi:hypothetical protein